jgi:hypothetical protein
MQPNRSLAHLEPVCGATNPEIEKWRLAGVAVAILSLWLKLRREEALMIAQAAHVRPVRSVSATSAADHFRHILLKKPRLGGLPPRIASVIA